MLGFEACGDIVWQTKSSRKSCTGLHHERLWTAWATKMLTHPGCVLGNALDKALDNASVDLQFIGADARGVGYYVKIQP